MTQQQVEQFIYTEARLQDEHRYDEWEALWDEDAIYWVPAGGDDPSTQVSYIYDNRSRIASRVRQLKTGKRHAQAPRSGLRRVVSNIEIVASDGDLVEAAANFLLVESRHGKQTLWAGRSFYRLCGGADGLRMAMKKVELVNRDDPIGNLAFLI
ncbi:aromatic-ring-hydroxylating dioxygenase subunit beta [Comamonadaceae bacterium G21597-S1]|nr:aromatic-ring-hydroxylating dioxygenase subunit beta [Comamonadaceae bacterium G21597-S1]